MSGKSTSADFCQCEIVRCREHKNHSLEEVGSPSSTILHVAFASHNFQSSRLSLYNKAVLAGKLQSCMKLTRRISVNGVVGWRGRAGCGGMARVVSGEVS